MNGIWREDKSVSSISSVEDSSLLGGMSLWLRISSCRAYSSAKRPVVDLLTQSGRCVVSRWAGDSRYCLSRLVFQERCLMLAVTSVKVIAVDSLLIQDVIGGV